MKLWLWERPGDRPARVIGPKTRPPGPGRVLEVDADSSDEAREVLQRARRPLPDLGELALAALSPEDRKEVRKLHADILTDRERVREVDLDKEAPLPPAKKDETPVTLEPTKEQLAASAALQPKGKGK